MGKVKVGTASGKGPTNWIGRLLGTAVLLFILFMALGAVTWENKTGLAHIDKAMKTKWFTQTYALIMGKAEKGIEEGLDKGNDVMMDAYGKGKKKAGKQIEKAQDNLDDLDREHLDRLIDEKTK